MFTETDLQEFTEHVARVKAYVDLCMLGDSLDVFYSLDIWREIGEFQQLVDAIAERVIPKKFEYAIIDKEDSVSITLRRVRNRS